MPVPCLNFICIVVCDPTADVLFESSDGVLFRLQSKSLAITSAGFAAPEKIVIDGQPTKLEETAEVLEILFQFIEPPSDSREFRYPSIIKLTAANMFLLAEAAEKYIVFPAMSSCVTAMQ